MENIYLNTEIKLSPEQQGKLFEGLDEKIDTKIDTKIDVYIDNMDTSWIVREVHDQLDVCDLYADMETYISDDYAQRSELDRALERIDELEQALGMICSALKGFKPPEEPEESNAE
jgi:soluble P-type ATPase